MTTSRAAVYTRISRDDEVDDEGNKSESGVERQLEDCLKHIRRQGWVFHSEYRENDISASKGLPRPQFDSILQDAIDGKFDVILVASVERLYREPRELEDLIDMVERYGLLIVNVGGLLDLATKPGQMVARVFGAMAKHEADQIGIRVKRQKRWRAEQGLPQGSRYRVYGFTRDWQIIDAEAAVVTEVFTRKASGESSTAIAKSLEKRGLLTATGSRWTSRNITLMLEKTSYKGRRTYEGKEIGSTTHPGIVDAALWSRANNAPSPKGTNARKHLLSGFLQCGKCFESMVGNGAGGSYRCNPNNPNACGGTTIKRQWVDAYLTNEIFIRWIDLPQPSDNTAEIQERVDGLNKTIVYYREELKAGRLAYEDMRDLVDDLRSRIKVLQSQIVVQAPLSSYGANLQDFFNLTLSQKKLVIAQHVRHIVIQASTAADRTKPDRHRIEVHWMDGGVSEPREFEEREELELSFLIDTWDVSRPPRPV